MALRVLKPGVSGKDVEQWKIFLIGQGFNPGPVSREYDQAVVEATKQFQRKHRLDDDGKVGNQTFGKAMQLGFVLIEELDDASTEGPNFPTPPDFQPLLSTAARQRVFGRFEFAPAPEPDNAEAIRILGNWESENIVRIAIPQLAGKKGAPRDGGARVHRLAAPQFLALFKGWEKAGLLDRVLTWEGAFLARFIRGSQTSLSNHSFGSAFDINAKFNPLGTEPALAGRTGSVRELVKIANDNGFYWGGHFRNRKDGMHFEIAQLK